MGNNRAAQRLNDTGRIVQRWDLDSTLTPAGVCPLTPRPPAVACVMGVVVVRAKMMPVMDEDAGRRRARRGLGLMRLLWVSCFCCWHAVDATDANIAAHRRPSAKSSRTPRRGVQPGARGADCATDTG